MEIFQLEKPLILKNKEANKNHHFVISTSKFYLKCSPKNIMQMRISKRGIYKYYYSQTG